MRMIVKLTNLIIGILIIVVGSLFMSITVDNETIKTISFKVVGCLIMIGGLFYLTEMVRFRKK